MTTASAGNPIRWTGRGRRGGTALSAVLIMTLAACGGDTSGKKPPQSLILYPCLSDESIQPIITAFRARDDGGQVDLFRAPTGELNARGAADARSGGLKADVIWGCDPLTLQSFVDQGLVGGWTPPDADAIPEQFRTDDYV